MKCACVFGFLSPAPTFRKGGLPITDVIRYGSVRSDDSAGASYAGEGHRHKPGARSMPHAHRLPDACMCLRVWPRRRRRQTLSIAGSRARHATSAWWSTGVNCWRTLPRAGGWCCPLRPVKRRRSAAMARERQGHLRRRYLRQRHRRRHRKTPPSPRCAGRTSALTAAAVPCPSRPPRFCGTSARTRPTRRRRGPQRRGVHFCTGVRVQTRGARPMHALRITCCCNQK